MYYFNGIADERRDMQPVSTQPVVSQQMVYVDLNDERVQDVVSRVQRAISDKYPDAQFATYIGTNPLGVYIDVYTERDEFRGILQVLDDRLGNLYIAAGVAVCVQPRLKSQVRAA
ncbi:MAG TPA: hypothetical protein VEY08_11060 [Chloroflexia bacterium]|nr:hypothetical protein [Chloroflexia bacterium]